MRKMFAVMMLFLSINANADLDGIIHDVETKLGLSGYADMVKSLHHSQAKVRKPIQKLDYFGLGMESYESLSSEYKSKIADYLWTGVPIEAQLSRNEWLQVAIILGHLESPKNKMLASNL